jgi:hypothetical protein
MTFKEKGQHHVDGQICLLLKIKMDEINDW